MEILTRIQEKEVIKRMAEEFLRYRLGIEPTKFIVRRMAAHIIQFEKEVEHYRKQLRAEQ